MSGGTSLVVLHAISGGFGKGGHFLFLGGGSRSGSGMKIISHFGDICSHFKAN